MWKEGNVDMPLGGFTTIIDEFDKGWRCWDCGKRYPRGVAHGHFRDPKKVSPEDKQIEERRFLIDKRNAELKRFWKKDQYAQVKARIRL